MTKHKFLSDLSAAELLACAAGYRQLASTARTSAAASAFLRLALRFETRAMWLPSNDNQPLPYAS